MLPRWAESGKLWVHPNPSSGATVGLEQKSGPSDHKPPLTLAHLGFVFFCCLKQVVDPCSLGIEISSNKGWFRLGRLLVL